MHTASIPSAYVRATWIENVEIRAADDDELADLDDVVEATVILRDPYSGLDEMVLTMTGGDVTILAPGIIEWRVDAGSMSTLSAKLYEVVLLLEDDTSVTPIIVGPVSIFE